MDRSVRDEGAYVFGPYRLDPQKRTLTRSGAPMGITPTVFDILLYLVEHADRVVSKEEMLDQVWPKRTVEESNIRQGVFTLRKALGEAGANLIVTAPGQGYRFAGDVTLDRGPPPAQGEPSQAPAGDTQNPSAAKTPPWLAPAVAAILALLLVAIGLAFTLHPLARPRGTPGHGLRVVVDFENQTRDPVFDRTLAKVLEIDLAQSPLVDVESDREVQETLTLMTRPRDEPLTPALADEVCMRTNGYAIVEGSIAAMGANYLLTLTATACGGGAAIAAEKAQVDRREAVIPTLDGLIRRLRGRLGEPAGSIRRFDVPLAQEKTASLAALKAYSEASWLASHGHRLEAMALLQHAIDLDPNFATADAGLAALSFNLDQLDTARESIARAYQLRDSVNEREKFHIITLYDTIVSGDYAETIRATRAWTQTYPRDYRAWIDLADAETAIGRYPEAIDAARQALDLNPGAEASYADVARPLMQSGRLGEAQAVCASAVARGLAGNEVHTLLAELAIARGDVAGLAQAVAGQTGKPDERAVIVVAARDAYRHGEIRRGDALYARAAELFKEQGLTDPTAGVRARDLANLGLVDRAQALLPATQPMVDVVDTPFVAASIGDEALARSVLEASLKAAPSNTLVRSVFAPETQAVIALRHALPSQALTLLAPTLWYEERNTDLPYLWGRAFLAAHDGKRAAAAFQQILDRPGVDPASPLHSLAELGLARALRLEGERKGARQAYDAFLADWRNADQDLPPLRAARTEAAAL